MTTTLTTPRENELREISTLPTGPALRRAVAFLADVTGSQDLGEELPSLLEGAERAEGWYVARRLEEEGAYSLQVFVWPPGTGTKVHDHASWGAYRCVAGRVLEERYERLDDGSVADHARLKESWRLLWGPGDEASTVLPGDGGIHRVSNPGNRAAVTVHLYGPRPGEADGRDYEPSRDHVCDRAA